MDFSRLRQGMIVDFHHEPVEVVSFDSVSQQVEIRRCGSKEFMVATCDDLAEDPQLHTDCQTYY